MKYRVNYMKEKYFKFLNSPFLLALCCALFTFFGKCFLDFACISAVSSIFLSILTTLEYREKINIRFMVKYSLFFLSIIIYCYVIIRFIPEQYISIFKLDKVTIKQIVHKFIRRFKLQIIIILCYI